MAWIQTPLPPVTLPTKISAKVKDEDANMDEGDAMVTSSPQRAVVQTHERDAEQQHLDYDVADEDDWGQ